MTGATPSSATRGQTTLPALAVALVVLTALTGLSLSMADAAIAGADRTPDERRAATAVATHLVSPAGPLADRENVLNQTRVDSFDGTELERVASPAGEYAVTVTLGERTIARTGDPRGGTTVRRIVLVERRSRETVRPDLRDASTVTLPRRASEATVRLDPPDGTTVWTVGANDRVLLHNESGLEGRFDVALVPYETTTVRFRFVGQLHPSNVTISYDAPRTTKTTLAVTVDA